MIKDYFYAPENLDLGALLEEKGYRRIATPKIVDSFYYLIDHIYLVTLLRNYKDREFVPINHEILVKILTTRWAGLVKRVLVEFGIIEENPTKYGKVNFIPNKQSKQFRFTEKYSQSIFRRVPIVNIQLLKRIEEWRFNKNVQTLGHHEGKRLINNSINRIQFDFAAARAFAAPELYNTEFKRERRVCIIDHFENQWFPYSTDGAGRFYHLFTSCPRDLRQFASFEGQALYQVDVSDCQPALHASLYPENSQEKHKFVEIVSTGQFKNFINSKLPKPYDFKVLGQKDDFKENMFHHVFYGSAYAKVTAAEAIAFQTEFPELAEIIKLKKRFNNKDLPVYMQSLEAGVVINNVSRHLAQEHQNDPEFCLISIHDCLVTTKPYADEVKIEMVNGFNNLLGFNLSVKIEQITKKVQFSSEPHSRHFGLDLNENILDERCSPEKLDAIPF